jgi:hypothetical protein
MQLERLGPYVWRIPQDASRGMRVPGLRCALAQNLAPRGGGRRPVDEPHSGGEGARGRLKPLAVIKG